MLVVPAEKAAAPTNTSRANRNRLRGKDKYTTSKVGMVFCWTGKNPPIRIELTTFYYPAEQWLNIIIIY